MLTSLQNITDHNNTTSTTRASTLATPCPFCNKHLAKYICPRCSRKYCSLECYRSPEHQACVEAFEQDGMKVSREERERMLETLRKYEFVAPEGGGALEFVGETPTVEEGLDFEEEEGERDEEDVGVEEDEEGDDEEEEEDEEEEDEESVRRRKDLEMRMAGLDIENADFDEIWERLDPREREEFVRLAQELDEEESSTQLHDS